jgi:hypothetical protein
LRLRRADYAVLRNVIGTLSISEWFLIKQFDKNVDPAIFHELMKQLARGNRNLADREVEVMESDKLGEDDNGDSARGSPIAGNLRVKIPAAKLAGRLSPQHMMPPGAGGQERYHDASEGGADAMHLA